MLLVGGVHPRELIGSELVFSLASMLAGYQQQKARARSQAQQKNEQQLDDILAKVKQHGIGSLSTHERRFLERVSKQKQD